MQPPRPLVKGISTRGAFDRSVFCGKNTLRSRSARLAVQAELLRVQLVWCCVPKWKYGAEDVTASAPYFPRLTHLLHQTIYWMEVWCRGCDSHFLPRKTIYWMEVWCRDRGVLCTILPLSQSVEWSQPQQLEAHKFSNVARKGAGGSVPWYARDRFLFA